MEYLRLHHIITLSTSSFTGMPHANTVAYANDTEAMYFAAARRFDRGPQYHRQ